MESDAAVERHPVADRRRVVVAAKNCVALLEFERINAVRCAVPCESLPGDTVGVENNFPVFMDVHMLLIQIDLGKIVRIPVHASVLESLLEVDRLNFAVFSGFNRLDDRINSRRLVHPPAIVAGRFVEGTEEYGYPGILQGPEVARQALDVVVEGPVLPGSLGNRCGGAEDAPAEIAHIEGIVLGMVGEGRLVLRHVHVPAYLDDAALLPRFLHRRYIAVIRRCRAAPDVRRVMHEQIVEAHHRRILPAGCLFRNEVGEACIPGTSAHRPAQHLAAVYLEQGGIERTCGGAGICICKGAYRIAFIVLLLLRFFPGREDVGQVFDRLLILPEPVYHSPGDGEGVGSAVIQAVQRYGDAVAAGVKPGYRRRRSERKLGGIGRQSLDVLVENEGDGQRRDFEV